MFAAGTSSFSGKFTDRWITRRVDDPSHLLLQFIGRYYSRKRSFARLVMPLQQMANCLFRIKDRTIPYQ